MDNKLKLNNNYSVTEIVFHARSSMHIPYIVGCIIEGPKGGKYALDLFGLERIVKQFNLILKPCADYVYLMDNLKTNKVISELIINDKDLLSGKDNEENAKNYAKAHKLSFIKRKDVNSFIKKITS